MHFFNFFEKENGDEAEVVQCPFNTFQNFPIKDDTCTVIISNTGL